MGFDSQLNWSAREKLENLVFIFLVPHELGLKNGRSVSHLFFRPSLLFPVFPSLVVNQNRVAIFQAELARQLKNENKVS